MKRTLAAMPALCLLAGTLGADESALNLPIGDPARSDREAPLVLDAITDTASGDLLAPAELPARLADVRLLFVGESHTDIEFHKAQLRVIQELHKTGREVLVGLEMFPYTEQQWLDQWVAGLLTEPGFLELSHWYKNWGYHWQYYRDIFFFARDNGIRMYAVNTPREVVKAVRKQGFEGLSEEQKGHIPPRIDTDNADHRRLFRAFFGDGGGMHSTMSEEQWDGMFQAQCTWDATMGYNAVQALEKRGGEDAIMVVLIGSGHVAYGLGAERQAALWFDGKTASLIPMSVVDDDSEAVVVRASYADFLWGLPERQPPLYPALGISTRTDDDSGKITVIHVQKHSAAAAAGFQLEDELVSFDDAPIEDRETLKRRISEKRWGDAAKVEVRRGEESVTLTAYFRRTPPGDPGARSGDGVSD